MKKKSVIIVVSLLIVVFIGILLSTQFGIEREKEAVVSTAIYEVSPVLTDLNNWPHWFAGADKYQFQLINSNPAGITVRAERGNIRCIYAIVAYADSIPSKTHLKWTTVMSGFDWLKEAFGFADDGPASRLRDLETYFDNPREFYGFDIHMGKVEDTLVLTKEVTAKTGQLAVTLRGLYRELQDCANKAHIRTDIDSCRMATFYDRNKDSVHVAAGIPITTRISPVGNGIRLLEMPPKGKMLVGRYQGPYSDISSLYRAMRKYVFDKKLTVVGSPYEKFLSKSSTARDSLNMTIELHFPVM